jgi:hypothetical protein
MRISERILFAREAKVSASIVKSRRRTHKVVFRVAKVRCGARNSATG